MLWGYPCFISKPDKLSGSPNCTLVCRWCPTGRRTGVCVYVSPERVHKTRTRSIWNSLWLYCRTGIYHCCGASATGRPAVPPTLLVACAEAQAGGKTHLLPDFSCTGCLDSMAAATGIRSPGHGSSRPAGFSEHSPYAATSPPLCTVAVCTSIPVSLLLHSAGSKAEG